MTIKIYLCNKCLFNSFRYLAIMRPLSPQTSKRMAMLCFTLIWVSAFSLALPMAFFYEFTYIKDELSGGLKPFCSSTAEPFSLADYYSSADESADANSPRNVTLENNTDDEFSLTNYDVYVIIIFIIQYLIPLALVSFVYTRMCYKLWNNKVPGMKYRRFSCVRC